MSVRRAKDEAAFAHAIVAPPSKDRGKLFGGEVLAALVEEHGFDRRQRIGNAPAGFGQFGEFDRPGQPLLVPRDQVSLGRAGDLSAGDDVEEHGVVVAGLFVFRTHLRGCIRWTVLPLRYGSL